MLNIACLGSRLNNNNIVATLLAKKAGFRPLYFGFIHSIFFRAIFTNDQHFFQPLNLSVFFILLSCYQGFALVRQKEIFSFFYRGWRMLGQIKRLVQPMPEEPGGQAECTDGNKGHGPNFLGKV